MKWYSSRQNSRRAGCVDVDNLRARRHRKCADTKTHDVQLPRCILRIMDAAPVTWFVENSTLAAEASAASPAGESANHPLLLNQSSETSRFSVPYGPLLDTDHRHFASTIHGKPFSGRLFNQTCTVLRADSTVSKSSVLRVDAKVYIRSATSVTVYKYSKIAPSHIKI